MKKISVILPGMDYDAAENMVLGGQLAMTFMNYLQLHPEVLYEIYPEKHKFIKAEEDFGLNENEIKDQFLDANRKALMIVSYIFKYIANQLIDEYDVEHEHFEFTVENKLMMKDIEKAESQPENNDKLNESEVFDELHRILGGL